MKTKAAPKTARYFTHSHNIEGCLRNGSYCRQNGNRIVRYTNGDYIGEVSFLPEGITEVETAKAKELLPRCCK